MGSQAEEGFWFGEIEVGTPPKTYRVQFDSLSSDLFLPGPSCKSSACHDHNIYNPRGSSTAQDTHRPFHIQPENNPEITIRCEIYVDTVIIGGLTVTTQAVGAAVDYPGSLASDEFPPDGVLGFAFPKLSQFGSRFTPLFSTLVARGLVTSPEFGVKLSQSDSQLFVGGVNSDSYRGDIIRTPVTEVGFWQISLDSANVNGNPIVSHRPAIIDTSSFAIHGPSRDVQRFYSAIPGAQDIGQGIWTFPCGSLPPLGLTFGGYPWAISPESFNLGPKSEGSSSCIGALVALDSDDLWLIGNVFLQNVYTVFNIETKEVGEANLK
ncbi:hypothetical protein HGRIS_009592 [Hohenbuehelia grisea]|uniref:Peptidase A1 domain-containing protein n=1 Tax=Hohenbuehelia grisea TaxID=104357 RepID=A0ABR3J233_9AGAR